MGFNSGFKGLNWEEPIAKKERKQIDLKTKGIKEKKIPSIYRK